MNGFTTLDAVIVVVYALASAAAGAWIGRRQTSTTDYFLGGRSLPWPAVAFSVVATETSVLTFIGVPAVAYGGNCTFLQLAIGYAIGRVVVAFVLLPRYFAGDMETAYEFLGQRFGLATRRTASITFMGTRLLADGVRLFATSIPLAVILRESGWLDGATPAAADVGAIIAIGVLTIAYTYVGGIRSVVWMDVVQMVIYVGGALLAVGLIAARLPDGFASVVAAADASDKLRVFDFGSGLSIGEFLAKPYTFLIAVLGGAVFSVASHGTDQLIVQRILTCRSTRAGQLAMIASGVAVFVQFALFLWLGAMLFAFYGGASHEALGLSRPDGIFPKFIVTEMPTGLSGLVVAALFAAAMSTLSSSLSSLSSATVLDIYRPLAKRPPTDAALLRLSRLVTLGWGVALVGVATAFIGGTESVVHIALTIAAYTYGALLGVFLLGLVVPRATQRDAIVGFFAALVVTIVLKEQWSIAWPLYTVAGSAVAVLVGGAMRTAWPRAAALVALGALGVGCAANEPSPVRRPTPPPTPVSPIVACGLDVLVADGFAPLVGKRVGVITNHTGRTRDGRHIADVLHAAPSVELVALFGPEHGVRGAAAAGERVASSTDPATGVPAYSLYGKTKKPTAAMLDGIDVLVFDVQDVGARFYTYIYTMAYAMDACAEHGKAFVVLDRPNPIGDAVEGPLLDPAHASFVGLFALPIRHGLTVGELARLFVRRGWVAKGASLDLHVVPVRGWSPGTWYDETGLEWVAPSPNMRTLATATVYPGTCLVEGTNLSEGRGTARPFEWIGAPWVDGPRLARDLNALGLPGVRFDPIAFTPQPMPSAPRPKHGGARCEGVAVVVTDRRAFHAVRCGVALITTVARNHPDAFGWRRSIERLFGSDRLRRWVADGALDDAFATIDRETAAARDLVDSVRMYR